MRNIILDTWLDRKDSLWAARLLLCNMLKERHRWY